MIRDLPITKMDIRGLVIEYRQLTRKQYAELLEHYTGTLDLQVRVTTKKGVFAIYSMFDEVGEMLIGVNSRGE